MPDIKITFAEVRAKNQQIRKHNQTLDDTLKQIKNIINALEADWTSDTSDTIRSKITGMQPKFDSYREVIESYAKFLDNTVEQYETTEGTLQTTAASLFIYSYASAGRMGSRRRLTLRTAGNYRPNHIEIFGGYSYEEEDSFFTVGDYFDGEPASSQWLRRSK